ncbi:MAG: transglutaminase domain-containing protein [Lachnospiraceae bacterium]|nr:transglutaminase domain-containing protein [Lachnospiraceae bacterium]
MTNAARGKEMNPESPAGRWFITLLTAVALVTMMVITVRSAALPLSTAAASLKGTPPVIREGGTQQRAKTAAKTETPFVAYADPTAELRLAAEMIDTYDAMSLRVAEATKTQAQEKLDEVGWDLRKAFDWCLTIVHNREIVTPDLGTRAMAEIGFNTGNGSCYVMSACFYEMAKELGYDAHQVSGYVPRNDGSKAPHSWVEIDIDGVTYAYDISTMRNYHLNTYQFTYGSPGTWRYDDYYRMN